MIYEAAIIFGLTYILHKEMSSYTNFHIIITEKFFFFILKDSTYVNETAT
jgi:hypothetical protein